MNFEEYWKNFGKLEDEVVNNARPNSKLEEDFKKLAAKVWRENEDRIDTEINNFKDNFNEKVARKLVDQFENFVDNCIEEVE